MYTCISKKGKREKGKTMNNIEKATKRGSGANRIYRMASMVKAYDDGYNAAIGENR